MARPPWVFRPWLNLLALGFGFTFIFTNFSALQNLESSLFLEHSDPGIGLYTLAIIYACAAIGCSIAPFVLQIVGTKWCLVFGAVSHALFTSAHFCSSHFTLFPAGALLGFGTGLVWPSQGKSVTKFAEDLAAAQERPVEPVVSLFNGVFFCLFMSAQIWGNTISSAVLKKNATETVFNNGSTCGAHFCPSTAPADNASASTSNASSSIGGCETPDGQVQTVFVIFLACVAVGLVLWALLPNLSRLTASERGPMTCKSLSTALLGGILFTFQDMRALLLAPMFFYTGLEQGIIAGDFNKAFVTCVVGIDSIGWVGMSFGICDAIASLAAGKAAKWTGQLGMLCIGIALQGALLPLLLLKTPTSEETWLLYMTAGLWGVSDAIWQTQTSSMVGLIFTERQETAFACWRLWQQLGFCFSFGTSPLLCTRVSLLIGLVILAAAAAGLGVVEAKRRRNLKGEGGDGGGGDDGL